ncbi:MAG: GNAT family N-acetyltransferase [Rhodospirillales bacterium]|nr:GNAT family N-acetyltransferase [Rhodospirillales bacterium]
MQVEVLTQQREIQYNEFLRQQRCSLVYATTQYRDFLRRAVGGVPKYLLAVDQRGDIAGTLGYFRIEAEGVGAILNSLPWYGSHGSCLVGGSRADEARLALLDYLREEAEAEDILSSTIVLSPEEEPFIDTYRAVLSPSAEDYRIGQITRLPSDQYVLPENLERVLRQKTRNLVRKSLKQGFELQIRDDFEAWNFFYETHVENMLAIGGNPKPKSHFTALYEEMPSDSLRLLVAVHEGSPIAALLLLYYNETVEYITPVIKSEYRSMQPLSFLIWHGMLDASRSGFSRWNWGGTWVSQKSLHHFKAGWGATDYPYSYLIKSSIKGRHILAENKNDLGNIFPYYYTYPYDRLRK